MGPSAAQRRVCSPFGGFAARVTQVVALVFLFSSASPGAQLAKPLAAPSFDTVLFAASGDLLTGKEAVEDHAQASAQAAPTQQQTSPQQLVIERIDFIGNRRVRSDTLKARIIRDRKSTRLNSSHMSISYAVFCLKKKKK